MSDDETSQVRRELAEARRALEISQRQKYGLQKALETQIETETREVESLIAMTDGDPKKLAMMLISERNSNKKRSREFRVALQSEMQMRARAELKLQDARATAQLQRRLVSQERIRNKTTTQRLRKANTELEKSNIELANRLAKLEAEVVEVQASNLAHRAQRWEQAFAKKTQEQEHKLEKELRKAPDWAWQRAFDIRAEKYQTHSLPLIKSPIRVRGRVRQLRYKRRERNRTSEEENDHGEGESDYSDDFESDEKYPENSNTGKLELDEKKMKKQEKKAQKKKKKKKKKEKEKRRTHRTGYIVGVKTTGSERRRLENEREKTLKALSTSCLGPSYGMYASPSPSRIRIHQVPQ